jgi:putative FmdB family regulatory protein
MPCYALKCQACGHRFETFAKSDERYLIPCTNCGERNLDTDWDRNGAPATNIREWHGLEQLDLGMKFDPSALGRLKRDVPDLELDERGFVKFRDNQHQRRVYRQMNAAVQRQKQQDADRGLEVATAAEGPPTCPTAQEIFGDE